MGKFFEGSGSSLISGAIGMIGGAISDRRNYKNQLKLMERQQQYNKELGEINQGYAKEMAAINQQYALQAGKQSHLYNQQMWDYTNYENQKVNNTKGDKKVEGKKKISVVYVDVNGGGKERKVYK